MADDASRSDLSGRANDLWGPRGEDGTAEWDIGRARAQGRQPVRDQLATLMSETLAAADARVAAAEACISRHLASLTRRVDDATDRADLVTSSAQANAARLDALAEHVDRELARLVESARAAPVESLARTDIQALRSELEAWFVDQLAQVRAELALALAATEARLADRARWESVRTPAVTTPGSRAGSTGSDLLQPDQRMSALDRTVAKLQTSIARARPQPRPTTSGTRPVTRKAVSPKGATALKGLAKKATSTRWPTRRGREGDPE